jgi:hypothetical protein
LNLKTISKVRNDKFFFTLGYKIGGFVIIVPSPYDYVDGVGKLHLVSMGGSFYRGRFDKTTLTFFSLLTKAIL